MYDFLTNTKACSSVSIFPLKMVAMTIETGLVENISLLYEYFYNISYSEFRTTSDASNFGNVRFMANLHLKEHD